MGVLATSAPEFESFLTRIKDDRGLGPVAGAAPQNARFIPRNFLLEERLEPDRVSSYGSFLPPGGPPGFHEWYTAHNQYLTERVFVRPAALHDYRLVDPSDPATCPETFRPGRALIPFSGTDLDVHLIRMVQVSDIAYLSGEDENKIFSWGQEIVAGDASSSPLPDQLQSTLEIAYSRCDHRPLFAAFYEDFMDELREPADPSWPDRLRDRLGLYHFSQYQPRGLPRRVFLFRYPVRDLPRYRGERDHRPLAVPVVLDSKFSLAFCPAPRELDRGRVVNLRAGASDEPAREVMHLFMPMRVEHLFRAGEVTTPVPDFLAAARKDHLIWLQLLSDKGDYGYGTDADLLNGSDPDLLR
jgi:hypothetical protein